MTENNLSDLREEFRQLDAQRSVARWRAREKRQTLRERLAAAEEDVARARRVAQAARTTAEAHVVTLEKDVAELVAGIIHTPEQITALEQALTTALSARRSALDLVATRREETTRLEQAVVRALDAAELTARAARLRPQVTADAARGSALEEEFQQVQEEYERLARNAQGEIIKSAKLVATTLTRFRTNKAVFEGPYDVVLVDEAGAATLPEVILATAKATRTAVLLNDFMQLGPVIEDQLKDLDRPDVKRWLLPDVPALRYPGPGGGSATPGLRHPDRAAPLRSGGDAPALAYGGMLRAASRSPHRDRPTTLRSSSSTPTDCTNWPGPISQAAAAAGGRPGR
ncbi:AAA domain-containing protein [Streptomyces sp. NPDC021212]|uniref:AAA domain-containing protein n=1 Tax=Streptomyces sp. NPDC021212 TaxID=3365118 RepID=UPI0037A33D8F